MRGQMLAMMAVLGIGGGTVSAQSVLPGGCFPNQHHHHHHRHHSDWRQVRSRWIDVNCTPTRVVYLAPRPTYPVYPPVYPVVQPYVPVLPPVAAMPPLVPPAMPPAVPAAAPQQAAAAPPPAAPAEAKPQPRIQFATPAAPQAVSKWAEAETPEETAARKLKLARYLEDDGLLEKARQRYQEIVKTYPDTPAAEEARQLLARGG